MCLVEILCAWIVNDNFDEFEHYVNERNSEKSDFDVLQRRVGD